MPRSVKRPRFIACTRCFRLKRKCDHAKPTCGECRRRGAECLPVNSCKDGDDVTVPLKYLRHLEARIAELEHGSHASAISSQVRDIGVQTEPIEVFTCDPMPDCNADKASPTLSDIPRDFDSQHKSLGSCRHPITATLHQLLTQAGGSENGLIPLPSPHVRMPLLRSSPTSAFTNGLHSIIMDAEDSQLSDVESLHDLATVDGYSFWLEEAYTNLYFSITHSMWPLLDCNSWSSWRHEWNLNKKAEPWKGFFVQMVHAIGSLSYNVLQPGQKHSERAVEIYSSALSYYPYVMAEAPAILQIQASILMILYSLHSPSSGEISLSVSSIIPFCSATLAEFRKRISSGLNNVMGGAPETSATLNESMFITYYMLNEIIVSGWERPVSAAYKIVDDDIHTLGNEIPDVSSISTALQHLFRLRKIQANIRRNCDESTNHQNLNGTSFKLALDDWRKDIPRYSVEEAQSTYLHPLWMAKLYDYSVVILMQRKRKHLSHEDIDDVLSAGVEVCLTYRRLQEEGQVMCFTWSALVFQFRTGILLLYICRLETLDLELVQRGFDAVYACAESLICFANRWHDATPYVEVFCFLLHSGSWIPDVLPLQLQPACSSDDFETYLEQLKKQYLHKEVLEMIEDMICPLIHDGC